jgi:hypothetical protein
MFDSRKKITENKLKLYYYEKTIFYPFSITNADSKFLTSIEFEQGIMESDFILFIVEV